MFFILLILIALIVLAAAIYAIVKLSKHKSIYPFMPFKYNFRHRAITFKKVLDLLNERVAKVLVETGTSRRGLHATKGDGAATFVFGKWAKENGAHMFSVDINSDSVQKCEAELSKSNLDQFVSVTVQDSLIYLKEFQQKIDFLYLDSYDYSRTDVEIQQRSQEHHLKEFQIVEEKLHTNTIVLIDDCGLPGGGKGKLVIAYMKSKGWTIVMNEYQVLLLHSDSL